MFKHYAQFSLNSQLALMLFMLSSPVLRHLNDYISFAIAIVLRFCLGPSGEWSGKISNLYPKIQIFKDPACSSFSECTINLWLLALIANSSPLTPELSIFWKKKSEEIPFEKALETYLCCFQGKKKRIWNVCIWTCLKDLVNWYPCFPENKLLPYTKTYPHFFWVVVVIYALPPK